MTTMMMYNILSMLRKRSQDVRFYVCVMMVIVCGSQLSACPMGYYGPQCKQECSSNCLSLECNSTTGSCFGGCKDGYMGDICEEGCERGFHGINCSLTCPPNCVDGVCNHVTGNCINGCLPGYLGNTCEDACSEGYYGEGCKTKCPANCAQLTCHHQTGHCLKGCTGQFWGVDCSLSGEFKENPEPAKQNFYKSLSAESKSVLLYVLMNNYEETLERAQMEVKRGIQQRNELRELIGGNI